jgi:signal peptidase
MNRLRKLIGPLGLLVAFGLAAIMLVPAAFGYDRFVILTGSMTGSYDPGALVFNKTIPASDVRVGDAITYVPPANSDVRGPITHRVVEIGRDARGSLAIRTKGDANRFVDDWRFTPRDGTVKRVDASIPHIGRLFTMLNSPRGRFFVFALPAFLIALSVLLGLWRDAGEEMRRRQGAHA